MTGLSGVNRASNSRSENPCGCSVFGTSRKRSTTLTKRTFSSGKCCRSRAVAAKASIVAMVAAARHHELGLGVLIAAGPLPDPGTLGAVLNRRIHVEILQV